MSEKINSFLNLPAYLLLYSAVGCVWEFAGLISRSGTFEPHHEKTNVLHM